MVLENFPDERHGFRRPATIMRTLAAELAFYRQVLDLNSPEPALRLNWLAPTPE